jgi:hypothetical protein
VDVTISLFFLGNAFDAGAFDAGKQHAKMFLVEYESGMRVVVLTANVRYGECHYKSQGVWLQDFPRKVSQLSLRDINFWQVSGIFFF